MKAKIGGRTYKLIKRGNTKMKINKCPKCGREPSEVQLIHPLSKSQEILGYEVECYDCGSHSGRCDTEEEAITKWNELTKGENK